MSKAVVVVTTEGFLEDFSEFNDFEKYPYTIISNFIDRAKAYVSDENYGFLGDYSRELAIKLMTAHLLTLDNKIKEKGQTQATMTQNASIHDVNVSLVPPVNSSTYEWWLNLTIYGTQLWALLHTKTPTGFFIAGSSQRVFR